jgi:hypothetical protein
VIDLDDTLESQVIARTVKFDVRNAIPEDIMKPSHLRGLGRYIERKIDQSLIETVPRACHQLMPAEPYLTLVPICCNMPNDEDRHDVDTGAGRRRVKGSELARITETIKFRRE